MALSASVTSTNTAVASTAGHLLGVAYRATATAGSVVIKDGGGSGTTILTIYTPASAAFSGFVPVGGAGIYFGTDLHATLTNVDGCTVFYQ